jgi:DNA-binding protein Fis
MELAILCRSHLAPTRDLLGDRSGEPAGVGGSTFPKGRDRMKRQFEGSAPSRDSQADSRPAGRGKEILQSDIGGSINALVDYLVENDVREIHCLIMGEVEKRILVRVLERTQGNKRQAAKILGINRNTFQRKMTKLVESGFDAAKDCE